MRRYLYLSMTPESLVASQLPPEEFGAYMGVGSRRSAHGQVMFFDLLEDFRSDQFDLAYAAEHCIEHADGKPKNSLYLAIYRVLERVPLTAINSLWLTTGHGKSLELKQARQPPEFSDRFYLYQELCPVHPLIASKLAPHEFAAFITRPDKPLQVPRICFLAFDLGEMANDPEAGKPNQLDLQQRFVSRSTTTLPASSKRGSGHRSPEQYSPSCPDPAQGMTCPLAA